MSTLTQFFGGGGGATVPAFQGGPVDDGITVAEVLLVGGGGSGSSGSVISGGATGGTSGEVIHSTSLFFTQGTSYTITIGAAATDSSIVGGSLNLIAEGGFPGGGPQVRGHRNTKLDEYTRSYGYPGAISYASPDSRTHGTPSCGGGATQPGKEGNRLGTGAGGGEGVTLNITGSANTYGSGGGGGFPTGFIGGTNGGSGGFPPTGAGGAGVANTGSGGGGGGHASGTGGAGGSGICVIRWPTAFRDAPAVAGNTPTPAQPGYYVYRWNSGPGSITF